MSQRGLEISSADHGDVFHNAIMLMRQNVLTSIGRQKSQIQVEVTWVSFRTGETKEESGQVDIYPLISLKF